MPLPDVDRKVLLESLRRFDVEYRDAPEWRSWETNGNYEYAIRHEGKLYPVKQIVALATGIPKDDFSGGNEANGFVEKRGFEVTDLTNYLLLRSNPGGKWQDQDGVSYHFGETVPNYRRLKPGTRVVVDTRLGSARAVVGTGTIGEVREVGRGDKGREFVATYAAYQRLQPPRFLTASLEAELRASPGFNVQHSIRRISPNLFAKIAAPPSAWILAGTPDVNDFARLLTVDRATWSISGHRDRIAQGDRIYIYRFGPEAGIVGAAQVIETPRRRERVSQDRVYIRDPDQLTGEDVRVLVGSLGPIDPPISREELVKEGLEDLAVIKAQGGSTFQVTPDQAKAIESLIEGRRPPIALREIALSDVALQFGAAAKAAGLTYGEEHQRLVVRFLASLLTRPFVILTGLSGSGKSQLALKLGQWFGEGYFKLVAVRPDWTGPEAMLGYEDLLQGAPPRPWVVGDVLKLALAARAEPQRPFLLLLDEMNLAHVERYFADFLSGLESGERVLPNLVEGEGSWRQAQGPDLKVAVPPNLFVVGTVNVDETTYMFSPKVLDRANTIEFRVRSSDLSHASGKPGGAMAAEAAMLEAFVAAGVDSNWHREHQPPGLENYEAAVTKLHQTLSAVGWEFGYRTYYDMVRFASFAAAMGISEWREVLDLQVLQKILPRLNGSKRRLEPALSRLGRFCEDLAVDDKAKGNPHQTFLPLEELPGAALPMSYDKVRRMYQLLVANQFASFAE